jgi:hypothetical protein
MMRTSPMANRTRPASTADTDVTPAMVARLIPTASSWEGSGKNCSLQ